MFEPAPAPRIFGIPPGADFAERLVAGLRARTGGDPVALARTEIIVNAARMERRLTEVLRRTPGPLPRIHVLTDLPQVRPIPGLAPARPALRRRLELAGLTQAVIERVPDLAPRAAALDLADSLGALLDEMQDEAVPLDRVLSLDVGGLSAHWARSLHLLEALVPISTPEDGTRDPAARLRDWVEDRAARWAAAPPAHPVLLVGSTGSRGTTADLIDTVARLPQGAVVLPGFDFDLPQDIWAKLHELPGAEDHPQDRIARLLRRLDVPADAVQPWHGTDTPAPDRNRLVSLALRPAPVTDQWRAEAPGLPHPETATRDLTLLEAPASRAEAQAIALILREALDAGETAALISPDRTLARQVAAALARWGIAPDDSGGQPLSLSVPGRLLALLAGLFGQAPTGEDLIALLKHPLTAAGDDRGARGDHPLRTLALEDHLRAEGPPVPGRTALAAWSATRPGTEGWADWVAGLLDRLAGIGPAPLATHVATLRDLAETLVAGPAGAGCAELWREPAGEAARRLFDDLATHAAHGSTLDPGAFAAFLTGLLAAESVRDAVTPHPNLMIWGTIEARVGGTDLTVLAGLNEGTWPASAPPDPWLNRPMRRAAGLAVPERRIGLQAHDFQQAIGARRVVLTRARKDDEAETIPSRWLNRLLNLLTGLGPDGAAAVTAMRDRGAAILARAAALDVHDTPLPRARRPAPRPPAGVRPDAFSITQIETLIRDPYAIYARKVLRLRALDPLRRQPDARVRGDLIHAMLHDLVDRTRDGWPDDPAPLFEHLLDTRLGDHADWPAQTRIWRAQLMSRRDRILADEAERRALGTPAALEAEGETLLPSGTRLYGRADRLDRLTDGTLAIYDYKAGSPPSKKQALAFNRQLHLEAIIAEAGGFRDLPPTGVSLLAFLGVISGAATRITAEDTPGFVSETRDRLEALLARFRDAATGYGARLMVETRRWGGDYDHLARYGEWEDSDDVTPEDVR